MGEGNFEIFLSPHTNKSAGVLTILPINDQVKFIETKELLPGRILNVIVEMNGETVNIINAYNFATDHYKDQVTFFNISKQLDHTENHIIGGDINALMCIEKDRRSANKISYYGVKASSDFVNICEQLEVVDVYRLLNPHRKAYTWREKRRKCVCFSRIDYFLVSESIC